MHLSKVTRHFQHLELGPTAVCQSVCYLTSFCCVTLQVDSDYWQVTDTYYISVQCGKSTFLQLNSESEGHRKYKEITTAASILVTCCCFLWCTPNTSFWSWYW